MSTDRLVSRRQAMAGLLGLGGAAALTACGFGSGATPLPSPPLRPTGAAAGPVRALSLRARPVEVDLGGQVVTTWAYGDSVPGKAFRATAGDRVQVAFANELPAPTSVHWHGLRVRNDMDGVPGVTTPEVAPGGSFDFDFVVPDPGTYWFHPHSGLQLDRGLYAPFVVDDPAEPGDYDAEWVLVLDDWTDGVGPSPEQILASLQQTGGNGGMGGMDMGGMGGMAMGGMAMGGMDGGDVTYPLYLVNGRVPDDPDVLRAKPGLRIRLRLINAGADTIFHVALAGHELTVTHTDGFPVVPVRTQVLRIGMGERYDAIVTLQDGVFPLVVEPVGKSGLARAVVRTGGGQVPPSSVRPEELAAFPLTVDVLTAAPGAALTRRDPDTVQDLRLAGSMASYVWTINGRTYDETEPLTIREGEAGRLKIRNATMMPHPVHVHGHTFQVGQAGGTGPRKDTVLVPAMGSVDVDLIADNPGAWMVHCHNAYHAEAGMMTRLEYAA